MKNTPTEITDETVGEGKNDFPSALTSVAARKKRFVELDFIRGICVILMIFDHFMCDVWTFFPNSSFGTFAKNYWVSDFRIFWHWVVVSLFFLLCGISCSLSRSNLKRGLLCFAAACFLTWGTYALDSTVIGGDFFIFFGVLHSLGIGILIFAGADFIAEKLEKSFLRLAEKKNSSAIKTAARAWRAFPAFIGLVLGIVYFTCIFEYAQGEFLIGKPYDGALGFFAMIIGFESSGDMKFYSADFFPIFPYASIILIGSLIGEFVYKTRSESLVPVLGKKAAAPVNLIGRNALLVYLLHQVVLGFVFALVSLLVK